MWFYQRAVSKTIYADGMANTETMIRQEQSDLGLQCLPLTFCPKIMDHYAKYYYYM